MLEDWQVAILKEGIRFYKAALAWFECGVKPEPHDEWAIRYMVPECAREQLRNHERRLRK